MKYKYKFELDYEIIGCINCPLAEWDFGKCKLDNSIYVEESPQTVPINCKLNMAEDFSDEIVNILRK